MKKNYEDKVVFTYDYGLLFIRSLVLVGLATVKFGNLVLTAQLIRMNVVGKRFDLLTKTWSNFQVC